MTSQSQDNQTAGNDQAAKRPSAVRLQVDGLHKSFGDQEVLTDINLDISPGEIFVLMGPSGSGKSVLLKHIAGLEQPTRGSIHIDGTDIANPGVLEKIHLALVFQAGALFNSMTVFDNLALYPTEHQLYSKTRIREKVMNALRILSLENAEKKFPSELSGGMRKRVAIARALVMDPQLILYDEPTSELDPIMAATISEIIASLKQQINVTTLVVSHDRDLSLTIADRVAIIIHGRIHTIDTPDNLRKSDDPVITEFLNPKINVQNPRFKNLE